MVMILTNGGGRWVWDPAVEIGSEGDIPLSTVGSLPCDPSGNSSVGRCSSAKGMSADI